MLQPGCALKTLCSVKYNSYKKLIVFSVFIRCIVGKSIKTESRVVVVKGCGRGRWIYGLVESQVSGRKTMGMDGGDGCTMYECI